MIEPQIIELTIEILENLVTDEIIYAEYAHPGAMGNPGGIMIYSITDGNINCYETSIFVNENIYYKAVDILKKNQITSRDTKIINKNGIFKFYGGGFGNNVLINKNVSLKISNAHFILTKDAKEYKIYSSVNGVFDRVVFALLRQNRPKKSIKFKEKLKDLLDKEKGQNDFLNEKLDKKIIIGKMYTEKEINAILIECCKSNDHLSLRRELIDNGFLYRTNDCIKYWRDEKKIVVYGTTSHNGTVHEARKASLPPLRR
jgi:hypothetical protein